MVPPAEYARYCRYLVGGDGSGREPQVAAGGAEVHAWDCYEQPTGIHYRPHADNRAHQDADWLDFQWCQTGHTGDNSSRTTATAHAWSSSPAAENQAWHE